MPFDRSIPVLIVNADVTRTTNLRDSLTQIGFADIDETLNGRDVIGRMRAKRYGIVIADWSTLPAFFDQLRDLPEFYRAPVLMIGEAKAENVIAAKNVGMSYLVRPFDADKLQEKIRTTLVGRTGSPRKQQSHSTADSAPRLRNDETATASETSSVQLKFRGVFTGSI